MCKGSSPLKCVFINMAQFDFIIIFPLFWSLILILSLNYLFVIEFFIPRFCSLLKFKKKILILAKFSTLQLNKISSYQ